jgi:hypothetical protein
MTYQSKMMLSMLAALLLLHLTTLIKIKVMLKVVHGKDRSGFHGTTIQPAFPKPSEKNEPSELIGDEKSLPPTKVGSMLVKKSNT